MAIKVSVTTDTRLKAHLHVPSILINNNNIIINGDKQLLSTEVRESIEKYVAEEGITILEE